MAFTICADALLAPGIIVIRLNIKTPLCLTIIVAVACLATQACVHTDRSDVAAQSGSKLSSAELASFQQKLSRLTFPVPGDTVQRLLPHEVFLEYRIDADGLGLDGYLGSTVLYFRLTDEYGLRVEDKRFRRSQTQRAVYEERAEILTTDEMSRDFHRMSDPAKAAPQQ